MNINILLSQDTLDVADCLDWVMNPACGGIDIFIGTVRNATKGKPVVRLEFEAYEKMAVSEMQKLADQAMLQWPLQRVAIHHRTGMLSVGEIPVIIAVAAAHRDAAFEACRFLIDNLKKQYLYGKKKCLKMAKCG